MEEMVGPIVKPGRQGLRELITDRILDLIRGGDLKLGSKLPPERELATRLGVSRTMVREALSALQLAGFVERRRGVGTVVIGTSVNTAEERGLENHIEAGASIAELIEARMATELGIVHLLCDGRDYDFKEVASQVDAMRDAVDRGRAPESYLVPSLHFHLALARATERPVVAQITENLVELMRPHLWLLAERYTPELMQESLRMHERILETIESGNVIAALSYVTQLYAGYPTLTPHAAPPAAEKPEREPASAASR